MEKQFVTYEIALKLKELGFDEPCFGYYTPMKKWMMEGTRINPERHFHGCNLANSDNTMYFMYLQNSFGDRDSVVKNSEFTKAIHNVAVPLWQQVIDWLREKHKYSVSIHVDEDNSTPSNIKYWYCIDSFFEVPNNKIVREGIEEVDNFSSFEEAREQAILKAIKLIKK